MPTKKLIIVSRISEHNRYIWKTKRCHMPILEKKEIILCLGSSCFARGNKKTLQVINNFIKEHNLGQYVQFRGGHCFGKCANGPILKINNNIYEEVDSMNVIDILNDEFDGYY